MSTRTTYLLGIVATILTGCLLQAHLCCGTRNDAALTDEHGTGTIGHDSLQAADRAIEGEAAGIAEPNDRDQFMADYNSNPLVLYFATGQAETTLTDEEEARLNALVGYILEAPDTRLTVYGHGDSTGGRSVNMWMGEQRADFFKRYLVGKGVEADMIEVVSRGPDEPEGDNTTPQGRALNRRIVVQINNNQNQ